MYIAIEGIKGSGKSTLIANLQRYFNQNGIDFTIVAPTKFHKYNLFEILVCLFPIFRRLDFIKRKLYSLRSKYSAESIDYSKAILLGDRSSITSYVTRLYKWDNPKICMDKIDKTEPYLPTPDYIILLDVKIEVALRRLINRKERNYGKEDESAFKLILAQNAYEYLMLSDSQRIKNIVWHKIDGNVSAEEVFNNALNLIELLLNQNKYRKII